MTDTKELSADRGLDDPTPMSAAESTQQTGRPFFRSWVQERVMGVDRRFQSWSVRMGGVGWVRIELRGRDVAAIRLVTEVLALEGWAFDAPIVEEEGQRVVGHLQRQGWRTRTSLQQIETVVLMRLASIGNTPTSVDLRSLRWVPIAPQEFAAWVPIRRSSTVGYSNTWSRECRQIIDSARVYGTEREAVERWRELLPKGESGWEVTPQNLYARRIRSLPQLRPEETLPRRREVTRYIGFGFAIALSLVLGFVFPTPHTNGDISGLVRYLELCGVAIIPLAIAWALEAPLAARLKHGRKAPDSPIGRMAYRLFSSEPVQYVKLIAVLAGISCLFFALVSQVAGQMSNVYEWLLPSVITMLILLAAVVHARIIEPASRLKRPRSAVVVPITIIGFWIILANLPVSLYLMGAGAPSLINSVPFGTVLESGWMFATIVTLAVVVLWPLRRRITRLVPIPYTPRALVFFFVTVFALLRLMTQLSGYYGAGMAFANGASPSEDVQAVAVCVPDPRGVAKPFWLIGEHGGTVVLIDRSHYLLNSDPEPTPGSDQVQKATEWPASVSIKVVPSRTGCS